MEDKILHYLHQATNAIRMYGNDPRFLKQIFATIVANTQDKSIQECAVDAYLLLCEEAPELPEDMK